MKIRIFLWSIIAALAGFLFGFDTVVISGAEPIIQKLWHLSASLNGLVMGATLLGAVLGSLLGGWLADWLGRRPTLVFAGLLYFLSSVGCGFADGLELFVPALIVGGLGIGISTVAVPLYLSEMAPPAFRGRVTGLFQLNIVFGIVTAFLANAAITRFGGENAWLWLVSFAGIPFALYAAMCLGLPESPRWIIARKGDRATGRKMLKLVEPDFTEAQLEACADEWQSAARAGQSRTSAFWTAKLRVPIGLTILVAAFNQLSGINAVLYFAPKIFAMTGMGENAAMLQSIGMGLTNLIFTGVGLALIDRWGRRPLLYLGSVGYISSLGLVSWGFFTQHFAMVPACLFVFIAAHAVGQGTVIWVLTSEVFPAHHRARGQALGSFTHWLLAALLTLGFPKLVSAFAPGTIFLFFCGMMGLQLAWVKWMVPETKGRSLEEVQTDLSL